MEKFDFSTLFWKKMVQVIEDFKACIEEGGDIVKFIEDNYERLSAVDYHQLFLLAKHTILRMDRYRPEEEDLAVASAIIDFICKEGVFTLGEPLNELVSRRVREGKKIESYLDWDIIQTVFDSQAEKDKARLKELAGRDPVYARELYGKTETLEVGNDSNPIHVQLINQHGGEPIEARQ